MNNNKILNVAIEALEDIKGQEITVIDTKSKTDVFDAMVIATGTSDRHVKALADKVVYNVKQKGLEVFGIEEDREWILIDLYDVIVHIMLQETREFYSLEKLWQIGERRATVN